MHDKRPRAVCLAGLVLIAGLSPLTARQLGSRPTEDWIRTLEQPGRVAGLKVDEILGALRLQPGDVVADIGAGPGVFSLPLAKAVSPGGKVYAVEIDQAFLDHIDRKVKEEQVTNVQTVLGKFGDPNLPARDVDLAFFHDVLHHVEDRAGYLKSLAVYLKTSARIAIIELDAERGAHRNQAELQVTRDQVAAWMAEIGFEPAEEVDLFTDKWFVVYSR